MTKPDKDLLQVFANKENVITLAAIACTLFVAVIFFLVKASTSEPAPTLDGNANFGGTFPRVPRYIGIGAFTTDEWGSDPSDHHILVREVFPGTPAQRAGLQKGDRVTHVGKRRVNPEGHPFQTHWLRGDLEDTLEVTLERRQEDGHSRTLRLEIRVDWIPSRYLQKARTEYKNRREGPGIVIPADPAVVTNRNQ